MVATKKKCNLLEDGGYKEEFNETQDIAIRALAYLTRCKAGKLELYEQGGAVDRAYAAA